MNPRLRALLERKQKALAAAKAITEAAAKDNNRDLSAEEATQFDAHMADVNKLGAEIEREKAVIEAERTATSVAAGDGARVSERREEDPRRGFQSFGEFARAVLRASPGNGGAVLDERLLGVGAAPTTYGSEGSGADGGFLVPPEFSREVYQHSLEQDALLPLTDGFPVAGNSLTFPRDETTPWGTDGIRAYWEAEAAQATQTKPKGDVSTLRLHKLMALVPVTDELAADANALEAYIGRKTAESIRWKTNLAVFEGSGAGQPKGFFGAAAEVSVAKETSQTADTINADNVAKMFARQLDVRNAVWLINHDAYPQLMLLNKANQMIYQPDFRVGPGGALMGRPVIITQLCKTVGDKGDICFANLKYYRSITKGGAGVETATSMHLLFDYGMSAFRATFRIDGQPAISAAVSAANGSNSLSPFVVLDARA